jgi:hypothetical protein
MRRLGFQISFFLLILAAAIILACGSGAHIPQSVVISPATANAQDHRGAGVQFTATAYYNTKPSPISPAPASWNACYQGAPTEGVSVSSSGIAQCAAGASGTYTIYAFMPNPTMKGVCGSSSLPCGGTCGGVVGTAKLTCP